MAIALADILDERHIALQLKSRRQANAFREIIGLLEKTGSVLQPAELMTFVGIGWSPAAPPAVKRAPAESQFDE